LMMPKRCGARIRFTWSSQPTLSDPKTSQVWA
jgi:hypothetical protein